MLDKAIQIAVAAHAGQRRKNGDPYVLHPLRIMLRLSDPTARIVGVLHDVVEDAAVTFEDLEAAGFGQDVLGPLRLVTHAEGVPYGEYIEAIAADPVAKAVKLADLEDNMNLMELPEVRRKDLDRMSKYHQAWKYLTESGCLAVESPL